MNKENKKTGIGGQRNGVQVMAGLIGMIKPLLPVMLLAVVMGCVGNLTATFLTVLGGYGLLAAAGLWEGNLTVIFGGMILCALLRGILRYAEQASNHYIAFKLLARIRHQVFAALRRLAPAKLDGSGKGNLISVITSDIELLEVFYAHTISPIAIAAVTSVIMAGFIGAFHPLAGALAAFFYLLVGFVIPVMNGRRGSSAGQEYRNSFGELNTCVLDNLYGLAETIQYGKQAVRRKQMEHGTEHLEKINRQLKQKENTQRIATDGVILAAGVLMAALAVTLVGAGEMTPQEAVIAVIAMMSSFGPTAALSALSNNLNHTLASGNRVLAILEEEPEVYDVTDGSDCCGSEIRCEEVSYAYPDAPEGNKEVLNGFSALFVPNKIHGILGKSGCGKSTLLKLLMRFYETDAGGIYYGENNIRRVNTKTLRSHISYVTQETFLFHDTIANNLRVAKADATQEELVAAARKASVHDFIMTLPKGYETKLSELGESLSGGERQRIGIARAFLHEADILLFDEPTSNLDSLNEAVILKSLAQEKEDKTILLVSHRKSTMGIAQDIIAM